jgi:hypothetical protein
MTGLPAVLAAVSLAADEAAPWRVNPPIVLVKKELYRPHERPGAAMLVAVQYVGPKLQRREVHAHEIANDVGGDIRARWSSDNGRTWSIFVPVQPSNNVDYGGVTVWEGECGSTYDPEADVLVQGWLRQIVVGGLYHCFTYWRVSRDRGRTWSQPEQFRYEEGAEFDPQAPLDPRFLDHNEGYPGNNFLVRWNGDLVYCLAHANAPGDPRNNERVWRMGSVLFLGRWDAAAATYRWETGARVEIAPEWSARGLMEPEVAELRDGRLLVVWRTSTHGWDGSVAERPGRKYFSLSTDGGRTLSTPAEWTYADGTSFYSPSSYHRMLRHSNGRLYWFGNISLTPPEGNLPRFPLVVAEVEEEQAALKRETVTAIDDRRPGQPETMELSNFSVLENRETHEIELYLPGYGQNPDGADCLKYTLGLRETGSRSSGRRISPWFIFRPDRDNVALLRPNAGLLRSVSVAGGPTPEFVGQCHELGVKVHLLVSGRDGNDGEEFATAAKRRELIEHYLRRCRDTGADGVDVNFESLDPKYRGAYSALLRELAEALHAEGRELSMCVSYVMCTWRSNAVASADPQAEIDGGWYDPTVIGETCDVVRVMCYDMISPSSGAVGPVSTAPWAQDAMRFWSRHVPKAKLVMGLPAYSRDFAMAGARAAESPFGPVPDLAPGTSVQGLWMPYEAIRQYRYAEGDGVEHVFFASDADSTRAHLRTAADQGMETIGFWHYEAVTPEMWAAVREWAEGRE